MLQAMEGKIAKYWDSFVSHCIFAIRTSVVNASQTTSFTNADNRSTVSRGPATVNLMVGDVHTVTKCHVVDTLSNQLILGYPDLKALGAVIDTASNEVRILKSARLSGSSSTTPATICSMASTLRLPGQHHAYVDITGPSNAAAFVSTF